MNATRESPLAPLLQAGVTPAIVSRLCGVQRSTAMRWTRGSSPRRKSHEKLAIAAALLERRREKHADEFAHWLDQPLVALGEVTPSTWIREGRDPSLLGDSWEHGSGTRRYSASLTLPPMMPPGLNEMVAQLAEAQRLLARLDLTPIFEASRAASSDASIVNLQAEVARNYQMLQAASGAALLGATLRDVQASVGTAWVEGYLEVMRNMSGAVVESAFAGIRDSLRLVAADSLVMPQAQLLARVVAAGRPPIGALSAAMDLQLTSAVAAALNTVPSIRTPVLAERVAWSRWFPHHPDGLVRSSVIAPDWLVGETHNAVHASSAALGRARPGVDDREVAAAVAGVTVGFPDLLAMSVPGRGVALLERLQQVAPDAVMPLRGAIQRLSGDGADDTRQAAVSMRAALDILASALAPGDKKGRPARYETVLRVDRGDPTGTLLHHQIGVLYASYQPLSDAVHDDLGIDALRTIAYGIFSAIAAVVARLDEETM